MYDDISSDNTQKTKQKFNYSEFVKDIHKKIQDTWLAFHFARF